jgi:hypothetical protein
MCSYAENSKTWQFNSLQRITGKSKRVSGKYRTESSVQPDRSWPTPAHVSSSFRILRRPWHRHWHLPTIDRFIAEEAEKERR